MQEITTASNRLILLVKRMMDSGREYIQGEGAYTDFSNLITETIDFARIHKSIKTCVIEPDIQPDLVMNCNSALLARALMNLMLNAAEATHGSGRILIRLKQDGGTIVLEVHDNGPGISPEMRERIFEPFFTSKDDGNGLGLLSLKICAQQHKAEIGIRESPLGGACFSLTFPMTPPTA